MADEPTSNPCQLADELPKTTVRRFTAVASKPHAEIAETLADELKAAIFKYEIVFRWRWLSACCGLSNRSLLMDTDELPPLPAPALPAGYYRHHTSPGGNYTADQMRAYGDARAAEELERAAALVESRAGALQTGAYDALIAAAAAIRDL